MSADGVTREEVAQMMGNAIAAVIAPLQFDLALLAQKVARMQRDPSQPPPDIPADVVYTKDGEPISEDDRALLERHGVVNPPTPPSPPDREVKFGRILIDGSGLVSAARAILPNNYGTIRVVFDTKDTSRPPRIAIERPAGHTITYEPVPDNAGD